LSPQKLVKNASDTFSVIPKAHGVETKKKSSVSEWHKWFKESLYVEITNEDNVYHFLQYQGYCSL